MTFYLPTEESILIVPRKTRTISLKVDFSQSILQQKHLYDICFQKIRMFAALF